MSSWHEETLYPHWRQKFLIEEELYRHQGGLQNIALFSTPAFGRVLTLDGVTQVTTGDEFIYHEMLSHTPIYAHGNVESVCVVGGGDGGMLREVLKHKSVKTAVLVEIDAAVVDFCRKYLPSVSNGAFDDPRTEVIIADGLEFMAKTDRRFDLIIIDSTDPIGPGECLFTEAFYADCARCLAPHGLVVNQNGVPFLQGAEITQTALFRRPHFADVSFYLAAVPTYVGGFMAFGWSSDTAEHRQVSLETLQQRFKLNPIKTGYYTPEVHLASFALPPYIQSFIP